MVKLTGPMMSIAASGKFADTMVFARKGGTAYARQRVIPFNPKSPAQISNRAVMKFLSQNWAAIGDTEKATWQALADSMSGVPFNAYTHSNMLNWKQFLPPGYDYPTLRLDDAGVIDNSLSTATGGVGQVSISLNLSTANDNWGVAIFRSTTSSLTPSVNNLVAMVYVPDAGVYTYLDSPLQPDTYYYKYRPFSLGGAWGSASTEDTAVVT